MELPSHLRAPLLRQRWPVAAFTGQCEVSVATG